MHIVIIIQEFFPFVERTALARESVQLARSLKQAGMEVSAVLPTIEGVDLKAHALARRLSPIRARIGDREIVIRRYDGRTPDGVDVNLLEIEGEGSADPAIRCAAAAALVGSFATPPDVCISFGREVEGFAEAARALPGLAETVLLANLTSVEGPVSAVPYADRVVTATGKSIPLGTEDAGKFAVIPFGTSAVEMSDKSSEKTALQMRLGFPVRADVPMTVFVAFEKEALAVYLSGNVQAVIFDDRTDCAALLDRYPDRLRKAAPDALFSLLAGADACVFENDAAMVAACLIRGTLPVCTASEHVVDLEPSLASGTGIVIESLDAGAISEGLARLVSAFHAKDAFRLLASRLPSYAVTWQRTAALTLGLVEEVQMENR